ncbi:RHS repeat-associated core domain protein [Halobacteroides halobius DSM 5150]|uniref:RHS repeat-associated core domain protein n=1 Tax=Halobacteroides halobius (strain ATCC 35273 / DSM 5150 / MD-1) TaxID=748449 RepID=L0K8B3_HALHC|nr:RHS repeat-associated core domain-containing protein [Halobacteroides halobius]AGB40343.1 RHS repeat-associated core domain protein [Halobacteroides halobius DSM 5150]
MNRVVDITRNLDEVGQAWNTHYDYNHYGELKSIIYPSDNVVDYTYTLRGLMDKVIYNGTEVANYDYNKNGAIDSIAYGHETITNDFTYDNRQRLTNIYAKQNSTGQKIFEQTYNYDNLGNVTKETGTYGGEMGYQYDEVGRLKAIDYPGNKRKLFDYDKIGNRKKLIYQHGSGEDDYYQYKDIYNKNNNQLKNYSLSKYSHYNYTYNENGSVTSKKLVHGKIGDNGELISAGDPLQETTYKYDLRNQLRQININGHQINFKYNTKGWRIKKDNGIRTTYYLYGKGQQVLEERDRTNQLNRLFIYGQNGRIASVNGEGELKYIISDQLGSTSVITDEEGNEVMRYKYSPFGNLIKSKGNTEDSYRFTGKEFDRMTGLYYYGARYYDPTIGRFISEDPIQDGWNWYVYCRNNPLKYVDPDGLWTMRLGFNAFYGRIAGGNLDFMFAVDDNWNLAFMYEKSAGTSISPSAATGGFFNLGLQGSFSANADTVFDHEGTSINTGFGVGVTKFSGGYDTTISPKNGSITHNFSLGIGGDTTVLPASFETHTFVGKTHILWSKNLKEEAKNIGKKIKNFFF